MTKKAKRELLRGRVRRAVWLEFRHRLRVQARAEEERFEHELIHGKPGGEVPVGILSARCPPSHPLVGKVIPRGGEAWT